MRFGGLSFFFVGGSSFGIYLYINDREVQIIYGKNQW